MRAAPPHSPPPASRRPATPRVLTHACDHGGATRSIFHSVNAGVGVKCRLGADGRYDIASRRGIVPIDRYSLVGPRRRDAIHPFFSAQFGVVQLMLNHLCGDA